MIYTCDDVKKYDYFFKLFKTLHKDLECIDLSKIPSNSLVAESNSIIEHHKHCSIFLGYLEPGWMLDNSSQVQLRKLFRKFPVGFVFEFPESLPFSWKNEIDTIYTFKSLYKHGESNSIDNGSSL